MYSWLGPINDVLLSLDGQTVTIAIDGAASGEHDAVDLANVHVVQYPTAPTGRRRR